MTGNVGKLRSIQLKITSCHVNHSKSHNYQPLEIRFAPKCVWSQVQIARKQPSWCLQVTTNGAKLQKGNSSITWRLQNVPFYFPEETAIGSITECWFPARVAAFRNVIIQYSIEFRSCLGLQAKKVALYSHSCSDDPVFPETGWQSCDQREHRRHIDGCKAEKKHRKILATTFSKTHFSSVNDLLHWTTTSSNRNEREGDNGSGLTFFNCRGCWSILRRHHGAIPRTAAEKKVKCDIPVVNSFAFYCSDNFLFYRRSKESRLRKDTVDKGISAVRAQPVSVLIRVAADTEPQETATKAFGSVLISLSNRLFLASLQSEVTHRSRIVLLHGMFFLFASKSDLCCFCLFQSIGCKFPAPWKINIQFTFWTV